MVFVFSPFEFVCLLLAIFLIFVFFLVFDFKGQCKNCGSRFRQIIDRVEVMRDKESGKIFFDTLEFRQCLFCRYRTLVRKKTKTFIKEKGKTLSIRL